MVKKCVLLLCVWKVAFLKSSHIYHTNHWCHDLETFPNTIIISKVYCFKEFSNQMKIDRMFSIYLSRCNSWQFNNIIKDHSQFLVMCHQTNHLHYGLETFFRCYPFIKSVLFWMISNLNHQFKNFLCKKFYVVSLKLLSTAGGLEPVILSSTIHCTTSCVKGLLCQ